MVSCAYPALFPKRSSMIAGCQSRTLCGLCTARVLLRSTSSHSRARLHLARDLRALQIALDELHVQQWSRKVRTRGLLPAYTRLLPCLTLPGRSDHQVTGYTDTALRPFSLGSWMLAFTCHICTTCRCCALLHKGGAAAPRAASAMCFLCVIHSICAYSPAFYCSCLGWERRAHRVSSPEVAFFLLASFGEGSVATSDTACGVAGWICLCDVEEKGRLDGETYEKKMCYAIMTASLLEGSAMHEQSISTLR